LATERAESFRRLETQQQRAAEQQAALESDLRRQLRELQAKVRYLPSSVIE
jgi:hypothetical protein